MERTIFTVDKNIEGYWVIRGVIGKRMYLYYTKREAMQRYRAEVKQHRVVCNGIVFYTR